VTKRQRSQAARRGWETRRANERAAAQAARAEHRRRSAAARRGWETRRASQARAARGLSFIPGAIESAFQGFDEGAAAGPSVTGPPAGAFDEDFDFDAYDGPWDEIEYGDSDADTGEVAG
jgi:hypothetical protein